MIPRVVTFKFILIIIRRNIILFSQSCSYSILKDPVNSNNLEIKKSIYLTSFNKEAILSNLSTSIHLGVTFSLDLYLFKILPHN